MTHADLIAKSIDKTANGGSENWRVRHWCAWREPQPNEAGIVNMIQGAAVYADNHRKRYESGVGEDGVLGDHWAAVLKGARGLLNGECGRLDCGTVDGLILSMLEAEGISE